MTKTKQENHERSKGWLISYKGYSITLTANFPAENMKAEWNKLSTNLFFKNKREIRTVTQKQNTCPIKIPCGINEKALESNLNSYDEIKSYNKCNYISKYSINIFLVLKLFLPPIWFDLNDNCIK